MDVIRPIKSLKKIKFSLVFFCATLALQCGRKVVVEDLGVRYKNGKAIALSFKWDQDPSGIQVFVNGESETPVLGETTVADGWCSFKPVVHFLPGQAYELRKHDALLASFTIEKGDLSAAPELLAIYPTRDTVPENLLKIYLQFSQPMQEVGQVLDFITVRDETAAKDVSVFLKLESELWNRNHDRLTLWLDPGRIKTDLIPNREQGLPLQEGHSYTIHISDQWKNADGIALSQDYKKQLYVVARDSKKPKVEEWSISAPVSGTRETLKLFFNEAMDAILAMETLHVETLGGGKVVGEFKLNLNEEGIHFKPLNTWKKGSYNIFIDVKLEDLAGNNLNRLFDTDLQQTVTSETKSNTKSISFTVH